MPHKDAGPSPSLVKERRARGAEIKPAGPKGSALKKKARQRNDSAVEDAPKSREAILSAALQTFARYGYDGASMPQIAKLAQVAPPLIHYYFGSKDKLWQETIEHSLGRLRREAAAIHNATRALAPLDQLRAVLQAHAHFAAHWPDHFFMFIAEARAHDERYAWLQENYTGVLFDDVVAILARARDKGHIRDTNIEQLALMLIGGLLLYFTVYPSRPKDKGVEELADEYTDMMFQLLYDGVVVQR